MKPLLLVCKAPGPSVTDSHFAVTEPPSRLSLVYILGLFAIMPAISMSAPKGNADAAREEAPDFEKVNWKKEPNLRKLYFWAAILCVASATTGYDGSVHQ